MKEISKELWPYVPRAGAPVDEAAFPTTWIVCKK
jgi:hypothetical protein